MRIRAGICLSVFLISTLCTAAAMAAPTAREHRSYTGEEIFRGVFLGQGAVAKMFPEVWDNPAVRPYAAKLQTLKAKAGTDVLVALLKQKDPTFFGRFEEAMTSGDPVRIDAAMTETSRLSKEVAEEHLAKGTEALKSGVVHSDLMTGVDKTPGRISGTCDAVVVTVAGVVAAVADAVVVAQVVAVVELLKVAILTDNYAFVNNTAALKNDVYVIKYEDMSAGLGKDTWVANIATRLWRAN